MAPSQFHYSHDEKKTCCFVHVFKKVILLQDARCLHFRDEVFFLQKKPYFFFVALFSSLKRLPSHFLSMIIPCARYDP